MTIKPEPQKFDPVDDISQIIFQELEHKGRTIKRIGQPEVYEVERAVFDEMKNRYIEQENGYGFGV